MEFENSRYVGSRTSLWCPVCGAREGQGCKDVGGGARFSSHDAYALGIVPKPQVIMEPQMAQKSPANRPRWTPQKWSQ